MSAWMRRTTGVVGTMLLAQAFLAGAGCSSSSGSRHNGCGGSCCGGPNSAAVSPAPAAPSAAAPAADERPAAAAGKPYGGQKTCPVTGEELGSMGPAIPVTVKGETICVCCRGCVSKVQREPDKYLPKALAERAAAQ